MRQFILLTTLLIVLGSTASSIADDGLRISWEKNLLKISAPQIPGGPVEVWWWEAFCRKGSTRRVWDKTTIPHQTRLVSASKDGKRLRLLTEVEPSVELTEELQAVKDAVEIKVTVRNRGKEPVDLEWFEPCIRVDRFTGRGQSNYTGRCFIFTDQGIKTLDELPRNEEALYRGGQVYVPPGISHDDVNPRPIGPITPANGLMGCYSFDNKFLLATAWDRTQHLFQGVIVCIHSDPHLGGLKPGEEKIRRGRIYLMPNDINKLEKRYKRDFHWQPGRPF